MLDNGQFLYVRYRYGRLTAGMGETQELAVEVDDFTARIGHPLDGTLSTDDILALINPWIKAMN